MINFLLNDSLISLSDVRPNLTVLEYLREHARLTGTKEGCASGDCGACTVVLAELNTNTQQLEYKSINSCITLVAALHGKQLITIEHLANGKNLHPVQQAMVDHHASQCGFCTPGFVMSMFALYQAQHNKNAKCINRETVEHALSGNLCRCTGYRPILDAALDACQQYQPDKFANNAKQTIHNLATIENGAEVTGICIPESKQALQQAKQDYPKARLVAGGTDIALESTQQYKDFDSVIYLGRVKELNRLEETDTGLVIGAGVTYQMLLPLLVKHFPETEELIQRLGSMPVRNQGTMGGNIANASPIGDTPPLLIALNARIVVDNGTQQRSLPAVGFFTGYRQTQMHDDEWIDSIEIPYRQPNTLLRAYKVSKRFEDDISTVCAVFSVLLNNGKVQQVNVGFGGVAATPMSLNKLGIALHNLEWSSQETLKKGQHILGNAFAPITDVRASAEYRQTLLSNLWHRFWLETHQIATQSVVVRVN
ncbi:xanthine dehydrogenase small subunit [Alteromonas sp. a30]|uniref:xanthine dehydrogenase small subunit n=1 Tax=Alteromonas sp. a30 TaxID=2730917 RepID=UPI00227EAD11|nr:xanthine dehydrogenase small subunit [Alteromonas sp. a30]MCY7293885.1 xanthine dehydrogenase small subunit [Alteromonas sp. a30]